MLPTACRKLMRVVSAVPRMEAFISQVSNPALTTGQHLTGNHTASSTCHSLPSGRGCSVYKFTAASQHALQTFS